MNISFTRQEVTQIIIDHIKKTSGHLIPEGHTIDARMGYSNDIIVEVYKPEDPEPLEDK